MEKSETIGKLAEALSKAQGEIKGAIKDSENPFFKMAYADLSSVWDACREPLSKNGLAVIQTCEINPEMVIVETTLTHSSGEWVSGKLGMKPVKTDPQSIGSCLTYNRRYSLSSIVGIAPLDDDDAEKASGRNEPSGKTTQETTSNKEETPPSTLKTTTSTIDGVMQKTGDRNGKPWTLYIIKTKEHDYSTFSKTEAEKAKKLSITKSMAEITYTETAKGRNLATINSQDGIDEPPPDDTAQDQGPTEEQVQKDLQDRGMINGDDKLKAAIEAIIVPAALFKFMSAYKKNHPGEDYATITTLINDRLMQLAKK